MKKFNLNERNHLLLKYVLPSTLSMVSIFLFTIVDGIFVGQGVGTDALGAVNLVFPYVMFFNGLVMLTTIGGLTITAIRIGRKDYDGANSVFMHSSVLNLIVSTLMSIAAIFFTEPICRHMGANDTFIEMACDYLFWYGVFLIPVGIYTGINGFARNDGKPVLVSVSVIISTALNIFGDWLLIFPLHMGLKGAAIATGVAQTIGLFIVLPHFLIRKGKLYPHKFKVDFSLVGKILVRGLPECVSQFCVPLTTVFTNIVMIRCLGDAAVNAYSIICYVSCFSVAIFGGCAEGLQPLFGNCYGAKNEKDLAYYKKAGLLISGIGSVVVVGIVVLLAEPICVVYGAEGETFAVAMASFPKYSWGFIMQAFNTIISAYLYSTTRTKQALIINILRSFVANIIVVLVLPQFINPDIIWYSFGIYEGVVMIISFILMIRADRKGIIGNAME